MLQQLWNKWAKEQSDLAWRKLLMNLAPKNKAEYVRMWKAGLLGNRLQLFDSVADLHQSDYRGSLTIRDKTPGSSRCRYYVPYDEIETILAELGGEGLYIHEAARDDKLTFQGEVCRTSTGWNVIGSTLKLPMRKALAEGSHHYKGMQALGMLRHHCNPKSFDMLMELFDMYDTCGNSDCVIEFSCYSINVGHLPHHNTLVWEVRDY